MRTMQFVVVTFVALMMGFFAVTFVPRAMSMAGVAAGPSQADAIETLAQIGEQYHEAVSGPLQRRR